MKALIGNAVVANSRFKSKDHVFVVSKINDKHVFIVRCTFEGDDIEPLLSECNVIGVSIPEFDIRFAEFVNSKVNIGFGTPFVSIYSLDKIVNITDRSIENKLYKIFGS